MHIIKTILSTETFPVRQPVLRPGMPLESCIFPGDDLPTTVHFGLYEDENLAGVISVFENTSPNFTVEKQLQIRGMAVLNSHQQKGFGKKLVQAAEQYATQNNVKLLWFNARENAISFYKKTGYQITGSPFDIPGIGIHYVMYKYL